MEPETEIRTYWSSIVQVYHLTLPYTEWGRSMNESTILLWTPGQSKFFTCSYTEIQICIHRAFRCNRLSVALQIVSLILGVDPCLKYGGQSSPIGVTSFPILEYKRNNAHFFSFSKNQELTTHFSTLAKNRRCVNHTPQGLTPMSAVGQNGG